MGFFKKKACSICNKELGRLPVSYVLADGIICEDCLAKIDSTYVPGRVSFSKSMEINNTLMKKSVKEIKDEIKSNEERILEESKTLFDYLVEDDSLDLPFGEECFYKGSVIPSGAKSVNATLYITSKRFILKSDNPKYQFDINGMDIDTFQITSNGFLLITKGSNYRLISEDTQLIIKIKELINLEFYDNDN